MKLRRAKKYANILATLYINSFSEYIGWPIIVSHSQESSLNRIKNHQSA